MGNPNDTPTPILDEKIQPSLQKQDPHVIAGRYTVLEKLGQGGMGRVYRAIDPILDRVVAVKVLISDELDERYIARFQREARAASHLEHSSIVRVIDFGITGENQPYMVLDLVEGEPLDELLQRQSPLSLEEAIEIMSQLCDAMQHAHNKNTIHRDLKPANIMIVWQGEKLRAMILDFGIAKLLNEEDGARTLTRTGQIIGSPRCMSPEQARGEDLDGRSDIYSLACIFFEMLTGKPPFKGNTAIETMGMHMFEKAPSLGSQSKSIVFDDRLEELVGKALAKSPDDRFTSMSQFKTALRSLLDVEISTAQETETTSIRQSTNPLAIITIVVFILALAAASIFAILSLNDTTTTANVQAPSIAKELPPKESGSKVNSLSSDPILSTIEKTRQNRLALGNFDQDGTLRIAGEDINTRLDTGNRQKLIRVWLSDCPVDKKAIDIISGYSKLKEIKLERCRLERRLVKYIASLKRAPKSVSKHKPLGNLDYLALVDCNLTRPIIEDVSTTGMKTLNLGKNKQLSASDLQPLSKMQSITFLYIDAADLDDSHMQVLSEIPNLKWLSIKENYRITRVGLKYFKGRRDFSLIVSETGLFSEENIPELEKQFGIRIFGK